MSALWSAAVTRAIGWSNSTVILLSRFGGPDGFLAVTGDDAAIRLLTGG
jgi:hypothetical protein